MPIEFKFKDQPPCQVQCLRDLNLLAHAQIEELSIGSRCGGRGICGGDRVQIDLSQTQGLLSPVTDEERQHLSPGELAQGFRLACQCFPQKNDLTITVNVTNELA